MSQFFQMSKGFQMSKFLARGFAFLSVVSCAFVGLANASDTASFSADLSVTVPLYCSATNTDTTTDYSSFINTSAMAVENNTVDIMSKTNGATVVCNGKTAVTVSSARGRLVLSSSVADTSGGTDPVVTAIDVTPDGTFNGKAHNAGWGIAYTLTPTWGTTNTTGANINDVSIDSDAAVTDENLFGVTGTTVPPTNGSFQLSMALQNSNATAPFIAGTYRDKVTVTFTTAAL